MAQNRAAIVVKKPKFKAGPFQKSGVKIVQYREICANTRKIAHFHLTVSEKKAKIAVLIGFAIVHFINDLLTLDRCVQIELKRRH